MSIVIQSTLDGRHPLGLQFQQALGLQPSIAIRPTLNNTQLPQGLRKINFISRLPLGLPRESAILSHFLFTLASLLGVVQSRNLPRWKAEIFRIFLRGVTTLCDKKCPQEQQKCQCRFPEFSGKKPTFLKIQKNCFGFFYSRFFSMAHFGYLFSSYRNLIILAG